ncbi:MAG TPA: NDP-hexose 2,3-dehydratase family protein [Candidatus Paceibacterota bacterium]|nr:NDP-hexose 2,3-dehydratase family protein [Candidatus Paceibacterota bacterium]
MSDRADIQPILHWLKERQASYPVTVGEVGVNEVEGWKTDPVSGDITHESGKFFSIIGVKVTGASDREVPSWSQPMLKQEEIGISGVLMQKKDGVTQYLFYAKFEPGNIDTVQISPALQVSEGNLSIAHKGKRPRLAEYFDGTKGTLVASVEGVEDGGRFYHKVNRSMLVEVDESEVVPITEDYIWLTVPQIKELLRVDRVVNSLARNVCALLLSL